MIETPSNEAYAVFAGNIDQNSVNRIFNSMAGATNARYTKIHLLFQSTGGVVSDGVCLYNFFRTLPLPLILRDHMTMPARRWRQLKHSSLWISAEDAVEYGIANSIGDFSPPFGAQIYNI
jgi:ATP-dependent protease ClpP protease subunit